MNGEGDIILGDHLRGLEQLKDGYDSEPAKGLIHGLQKDAIQNSVNAARSKKFTDFMVLFELHDNLNGATALSFTDSGTTGLEGSILTQEEIMSFYSKGKLGVDEHLSRIRVKWVSGGNEGAGLYGRGKDLFMCCSEKYKILVESFRESDDKYVAFTKYIDSRKQLVESPGGAKVDEEADQLVAIETGGKYERLPKHGTRITILNLEPKDQLHGVSIKEAFLRSFETEVKDPNCEVIFSRMIQETWWELLFKYKNVQIFLKHNDDVKKVEIEIPLLELLSAKDKVNGYRVYHIENRNVRISGEEYRIKELHLVVSPTDDPLPENFQNISTQRKKMKIGPVSRGLPIHRQIRKNLYGHIIFDKDLDYIMSEPENLEHYGYKTMNDYRLRALRAFLKDHISLFQDKLGFGSRDSDATTNKVIRDVLQDLNAQANELGLITSLGASKNKVPFKINITDFNLPRKDSARIEYEDSIGPINLKIGNLLNVEQTAKLKVSVQQKESGIVQSLLSEEITIDGLDSLNVIVPSFSVNSDFYYGTLIKLVVELEDKRIQNTRFLWLGIDPEISSDQYPVNLKQLNLQFVRPPSLRVELGENLNDFNFTIYNKTANELRCRLLVTVRRKLGDSIILNLNDEEIILPGLSEQQCSKDSIKIDENFTFFDNEPEVVLNRECYVEIKLLSNLDTDEYAEGQKLMATRKIKFLVGIDDDGTSIFSKTSAYHDPNDPRKSFWEESAGEFVFSLNTAHPLFIRYSENPEVQKDYMLEEMLRSAYSICIYQEVYSGIFWEEDSNGEMTYEDHFSSESSSNEETITIFEELIGKSIHKIYS